MKETISDTSSDASRQGAGWLSCAERRGHRKKEDGKEVKGSNNSWLFFKPLILGTVK